MPGMGAGPGLGSGGLSDGSRSVACSPAPVPLRNCAAEAVASGDVPGPDTHYRPGTPAAVRVKR